MNNIQFSGPIDASTCVSSGWELVKRNYWMYFGITILMIIITGCIPLVNIFVTGPIMVGVNYVLLRDMRGEPVEFGMMFKGFEKFVPAMVVGLIMLIPDIIFQLVRFSINIGEVLSGAGRRGDYYSRGDDAALPILAGLSALWIIFALGFLVFRIFWAIAFFFTMPLLAEHDLGAIDAIKLSARAAFSNIGGIIVLLIIEVGIGILGFIALCFGFFFVLPILYAANAFAYRQVFPQGPGGFYQNTPPAPNVYGSTYGQGQ